MSGGLVLPEMREARGLNPAGLCTRTSFTTKNMKAARVPARKPPWTAAALGPQL